MEKWLRNINTQKLLKYYWRLRWLRLIMVNPILRTLALVLGAVVLLFTWPFLTLYGLYRLRKFQRNRRKLEGDQDDTNVTPTSPRLHS
jgi:hypothetical protein